MGGNPHSFIPGGSWKRKHLARPNAGETYVLPASCRFTNRVLIATDPGDQPLVVLNSSFFESTSTLAIANSKPDAPISFWRARSSR